jgi:hypothetical protein
MKNKRQIEEPQNGSLASGNGPLMMKIIDQNGAKP